MGRILISEKKGECILRERNISCVPDVVSAKNDFGQFVSLHLGHAVANLPLVSITAADAAKSLQSCPTLCDPIDSSPPGSPVPGILQARTLILLTSNYVLRAKWLTNCLVNLKLL